MSMSDPSRGGVGTVMVETSSDGGHPLQFYANRITDKLMYVAANAPEPIRQQALEYRENMHSIIADGLSRAIKSDHASVAHALRKAGMTEAADLVASL